MPSTTHGLPYPSGSNPTTIPGDLSALAGAVDTTLSAPLLDSWTSWTPVWSSSGTQPVIGDGTIVGLKREVGKTVFFRILITLGSTTTVGTGNYSVSLPSDPLMVFQPFNGLFYDASASAIYPLHPARNTSAIAGLFKQPTTAGNPLQFLSATAPVVPASGDQIIVSGFYEAA